MDALYRAMGSAEGRACVDKCASLSKIFSFIFRLHNALIAYSTQTRRADVSRWFWKSDANALVEYCWLQFVFYTFVHQGAVPVSLYVRVQALRVAPSDFHD